MLRKGLSAQGLRQDDSSAFKAFDKSRQPERSKNKNQTEGGHSIVKKCTVNLIETYQKCNKDFIFDDSLIPKRYLTFPCEGIFNGKNDNENYDYIMKVRDIIFNDQSKREYIIEDMLGKGTFGQVVKCTLKGHKERFAIKVIKNKQAFHSQAKNEILVLKVLNKLENLSKLNHPSRIVHLLDYFAFKNHFCLVFEMMETSLFDCIKDIKFSGFSFEIIASWTRSILEGMVVAELKNIIHCDLKPENIMLKKQIYSLLLYKLIYMPFVSNELKIIDFGSACFQNKHAYTYIQSRFYRAPEIILGIDYTMAIDVWSLGCILIELYLGLPIFPGNCEYDQMRRIIDLLGHPSQEVIEKGKFKNKLFVVRDGQYKFKTKEEYQQTQKVHLKESKQYLKISTLSDLRNYMYKSSFRREEEDERINHYQFDLFLDLAKQLLELDPKKRIPASVAIRHPFLNQFQKENTYERFEEQIYSQQEEHKIREEKNETTSFTSKTVSEEKEEKNLPPFKSSVGSFRGTQLEGGVRHTLAQIDYSDLKSQRF